MSKAQTLKYYEPFEEKINILSHAFGLLLSCLALFFLMYKAINYGDILHQISFAIFGVSLIMLYAASTIYHSSKNEQSRRKYKIFDHAAIYILIAGTYTPLTLVTLKGKVGWTLFATTWSIATIGVVLKLFFTGRFKIVSTLAYVLMGWLIVFAFEPLKANLAVQGVNWLIAGGIAYTIGAVLYAIAKIKFNHAIFHLFVLLGSFCHFVSIYFYVLQVS